MDSDAVCSVAVRSTCFLVLDSQSLASNLFHDLMEILVIERIQIVTDETQVEMSQTHMDKPAKGLPPFRTRSQRYRAIIEAKTKIKTPEA